MLRSAISIHVEILEDKLDAASTELKQLRSTQKAQKREIRKVAAAAANEEIRAQTERFEAKLRAKEAKVKDARKKAKAVRIAWPACVIMSCGLGNLMRWTFFPPIPASWICLLVDVAGS